MQLRIVLASLFLVAGAVPVLADNATPSPAAPLGNAPATAATPPAPTPAAAGPRLNNFADLVFDGIVGENAPEVSADFVSGATLGSMPLAFEKTKLADIQATYGGQLHSQGDAGNAVFTAHRDTHFAFLAHVHRGDILDVERVDGVHVRYRVGAMAIVDVGSLALRAHADVPTLTLVTCYPFDAIAPNTPLRYVVSATIEEEAAGAGGG